MDINKEFPMLVYAVAVCTQEGYQFTSKCEDGITLGTYQPKWLHLRTHIIDSYRFAEGCLDWT